MFGDVGRACKKWWADLQILHFCCFSTFCCCRNSLASAKCRKHLFHKCCNQGIRGRQKHVRWWFVWIAHFVFLSESGLGASEREQKKQVWRTWWARKKVSSWRCLCSRDETKWNLHQGWTWQKQILSNPKRWLRWIEVNSDRVCNSWSWKIHNVFLQRCHTQRAEWSWLCVTVTKSLCCCAFRFPKEQSLKVDAKILALSMKHITANAHPCQWSRWSESSLSVLPHAVVFSRSLARADGCCIRRARNLQNCPQTQLRLHTVGLLLVSHRYWSVCKTILWRHRQRRYLPYNTVLEQLSGHV